MFSVAKQEFGDVDVVCPGAGVYEPVRGDSLLSYHPTLRSHLLGDKMDFQFGCGDGGELM